MFDALLTLDELEASTQRMAADPRVELRMVGHSRLGRPIQMISLGTGTRNALLVGAPHPNEPAGAATVERMITYLLANPHEGRGYRWHFIKAIDPEGLRLNGGWLKKPRTIGNYLENFFRPALSRQPETTFPLQLPGVEFSASTPENQAWQRAFELTRPDLHATLHHCDYGGVFYSLSRALPGAISGLEAAVRATGLSVHEIEDVMTMDRWSPAVTRYPTVLETTNNAKASGASWAYPWTVGDMSPGYGETHYGTLSLVAEVPMWHSAAIEDPTPSGVSRVTQRRELREMATGARRLALAHAVRYTESSLGPDARECLWALEAGLKMMPASDAGSPTASTAGADDTHILSRHEYELHHTHDALFVLRTYGLLLSLANQVLLEHSASAPARETHKEATAALRREVARLESRSTLVPVPVRVMTGLQMAAVFVCADALNG